MLSFSPLLGINLPMLGARSSLITTSRIPLVRLTQIEPLARHYPLIRTSKLLSARTEQPEIGWDNWNPLDASFDLDRFDATLDRDSLSENLIEDRFDRLDSVEERNLDFFTTILAPESVASNTPDLSQRNDNNSSVSQDDLKITTSPGEKRTKSQRQSKSSNSLHKSPDLVKVARKKSKEILLETTAQINSEITPPHSREIGVERKTIDEFVSEFPTDNLPLNPLSIPTNIAPNNSSPFSPPDATPTPFNQLEVNTESVSELPADNLHLNPLSIQTNINRSTLLPSLQPDDATPTPSNHLEDNTESVSELPADNLPLNPLSIPTNINPPTLAATSPPSSPLDTTSTPSNQLEVNTESVSELPADNLYLNPLSIPANITPATLPPAATPTPSNQLEVNTDSASELPTDNLYLNPLSIQTNVNPSTLAATSPPSSPPNATLTPSNQLEVNTDSASELPTDNLHLNPLSIQTNINRSTLLPSLQLEETLTPSDERRVDTESANELRPDHLPPSLFSTTIMIDEPLTDLPTDASIDVENRLTEITNDSDRLIGKNSATNLNLKASDSSDLQAEELLSSPAAPLEEDLIAPTPVQGYATGGYVKESDRVNPESIAASDTVAAMLTPGEFVINAKDAQKNLDLLTHINRGGQPDRSIASDPHLIESPVDRKTSPINLQTFIQPKSHEPLISNSLQSEVNLHQISFLDNFQLNTFENSPSKNNLAATNYVSPALIFRKPQSSNRSIDRGFDRTPDEWGNIEELMNGGNNESDTFNFNDFNPALSSPPNNNVDKYHSAPASPNIALKHVSSARGFADGGEVTPADVSTQTEPITVTIEAPSSNNRTQNNDTAELEILAREIYHRLRQRLEIERERHGSYSGNLSW
jgi:hypothetical protein